MRSPLILSFSIASIAILQSMSTLLALQDDTRPGETGPNLEAPAPPASESGNERVERVLAANQVPIDLREAALKELAAIASAPDVVVPFEQMSEGRRGALEQLALAWAHSIPPAEMRTQIQDELAMARFTQDMRRVFQTPVYATADSAEVAAQLDSIRLVCEESLSLLLSDAFPESKDLMLKNVAPRLLQVVVDPSATVDMWPRFKYPIPAAQLEKLQGDVRRRIVAIGEVSLLPEGLQKEYGATEAAKRDEFMSLRWTAVLTNLTPKVAEVGALVATSYDEAVPEEIRADFAKVMESFTPNLDLEKRAFEEMTQLQKKHVEEFQRKHQQEFEKHVEMLQGAPEPDHPVQASSNTGRLLLVLAATVLLVVVGFVVLRRR